jgi:putative ABC transport system ATP-binding protein
MSLIELKGVHKDYFLGETRIAALRGVELVIDPGEFAAIWGPSGSGKSTLCNLIGMLDRPSSGSVWLNHRDITDLSDDERSDLRNEAIGIVFQGFNLVPVLSAAENVMLPLLIRGTSTRKAMAEAIHQLTELGLKNHVRHRPHKLSGGEQQRVAIARALINKPRVVVADEPTANLDSDTAIKIIDLMRQINSTSGVTFIFSTHDQRLLERVHRRILLKDGAITNDTQVPLRGMSGASSC